MKLTAKLNNVASMLKAKWVEKRRPPKLPKPIKVDLRQREKATPLVIDFTDHVCISPFKLRAITVVYTLFVSLLP